MDLGRTSDGLVGTTVKTRMDSHMFIPPPRPISRRSIGLEGNTMDSHAYPSASIRLIP